jgi:RNA polymerase sigma-70 factor, ECF subfamily
MRILRACDKSPEPDVAVTPDTRPSILLRLSDRSDQEAWQIFESVYRPIIFRAARARGLQDADACDVAQAVLIRVSEGIKSYDPGHRGARFRTWLATITRHIVIDHLRARSRACAPILIDLSLESEHPFTDDGIDQQLEREYHLQLFRWAAASVKREFSPEAWQAFWETAVAGRPIAETASRLGRSTGSVYTIRARVMRRLKQEVERFDMELERES